MSKPEPSISEMLNIGHGNGLKTVDDAWMDYTRHADLFFNLEKYGEQISTLWEKMRAAGILGMEIPDALEKIGQPLKDEPAPDLGSGPIVTPDIPF